MSVALSTLQPVPRRDPPIRLIAECAALRYGVTFSEMISARRTKALVLPRHIAMHLARKMTACAYPVIGARLGGRDHTTIMHGDRRIQQLLDRGDREVRHAVAEIETAIEAAQILAQRTSRQIYVDADAMDLATRVLDHDPHRISLDELRIMASFIRAVSAPIVELIHGYATSAPVLPRVPEVPSVQPQPMRIADPHPLVIQATTALADWQRFQTAEHSPGERAARATLTTTMLRLSAALKEI